MRLKHACFWLGLLCLAPSAPAQAGDWGVRGPGSIKDYGGVPVPAPIPVAENFRWYLRADLGVGIGQEASISERGFTYGDTTNPSTSTTGMDSAWFNQDFDTFLTGGVGVGLYLTPRLRGDVTFDARTKRDADVDHTGSYPIAGPSTVNFHSWEQTQVRDFLTLANLYWDLTQRGSAVTPYIGVGAGFVVRTVDRRHLTTLDRDLDGSFGDNPDWSGNSKSHQVAPAAALMAGLAWSITQTMLVDVGYRFTWLGGAETSTDISNGTTSKLKIGDTFDHEIRAGLRWNVW